MEEMTIPFVNWKHTNVTNKMNRISASYQVNGPLDAIQKLRIKDELIYNLAKGISDQVVWQENSQTFDRTFEMAVMCSTLDVEFFNTSSVFFTVGDCKFKNEEIKKALKHFYPERFL